MGYGRLVRGLLAGPLGALAIELFEPTARVFPDAETTAAIVAFEVGARLAAVRLRRLAAPGDDPPGRTIARAARASGTRPLSRAGRLG